MFGIRTTRSAPQARSARTSLGGAAVRGIALGALAALSLAAGVPAGAAAAPEPAEWVALGDSYTAGVFVGEPRPALGSADRDGCDRTTGAYPNLVERRLTAEPPAGRLVRLTDFSCGGATINEIASARQTPISPVRAPEDGWPSVASQVDRAGLSASTDVVTIGVGGNSLPFGKILTSCLLAGIGQPDEATPCRDAYEAGGPFFDPESIYDKYDRVTREYAGMLRAVHEKAPNARVIEVGYPTILPEDPTTCDRQDTTELAADIKDFGRLSATHGDIAWLGEVNTHLNAIVEAVTELSDDTYVDTAASSVGHDACGPRATKWVEGVCGEAGPYWPDELAVGPLTLTCSGGDRATLVHPNAAGHAHTATRVEAAVRTALTPATSRS
ncbi:SGNH/GDSL hydrolase family protein [Streptomyces sp. NPDC087219]|uniref:SGNH/GDSL hydrolase family protein n=1 Tax=Streptomyces sp. NPDC087219 TaxID=3365770 RepID=UPI0037F49DA1